MKVTTDLRKGCTESHTGTSASAPLAAGICALVLQVKYLSVLHVTHSFVSLLIHATYRISSNSSDPHIIRTHYVFFKIIIFSLMYSSDSWYIIIRTGNSKFPHVRFAIVQSTK